MVKTIVMEERISCCRLGEILSVNFVTENSSRSRKASLSPSIKEVNFKPMLLLLQYATNSETVDVLPSQMMITSSMYGP